MLTIDQLTRLTVLFICSIILHLSMLAQGFTWSQRTSMPVPRYGAATFVIDGKAYVIGGASASVEFDQMWAYDIATDSWEQKASIPGARRQAISFSINGKGYVGCGITNTNTILSDLWEYDPGQNTWTQKAAFPTGPRYNTWQFVIGGVAYVGGGNSGSASGPFHDDAFTYDPVSNAWSSAPPIPDQGRHGAPGFSLNNMGYVVCGRENSLQFVRDIWRYDPLVGTWSALPQFPGPGRSSPLVFIYDNKVVIGCGRDGSINYYDVWVLDPSGNTWSQLPDYPGASAMAGSSFSHGNRAFGGLGWDLSTNLSHSDLWELERTDVISVDEYQGRPNGMRISPVPARVGEELRITHDLNSPIEVEVLDMSGRLIRRTLITVPGNIPTVGLDAGSYMIRWRSNDLFGSHTIILTSD